MLKSNDFNLLRILKNTERLYYSTSTSSIKEEAEDIKNNPHKYAILNRNTIENDLAKSYLTLLKTSLFGIIIKIFKEYICSNADGMFSIYSVGDTILLNLNYEREVYSSILESYIKQISTVNSFSSTVNISLLTVDNIENYTDSNKTLCNALTLIYNTVWGITVVDTPEKIENKILNLFEFKTNKTRISNTISNLTLKNSLVWRKAYDELIFSSNKIKTERDLMSESWYSKLSAQANILKYLSNYGDVRLLPDETYEPGYNTKVLFTNDALYVYELDDCGNTVGEPIKNELTFTEDGIVIKNAGTISKFTLDDYNNQSFACECGHEISAPDLLFAFKKVNANENFLKSCRDPKSGSFLYEEVQFFLEETETHYISDNIPGDRSSTLRTYGALCSHNIIFCNKCGKIHILPNLLIKFLQAFHASYIFSMNESTKECTYPIKFGYKADSIISKVLNRYNEYLVNIPLVAETREKLDVINSKISNMDKTSFDILMLSNTRDKLQKKIDDTISNYSCEIYSDALSNSQMFDISLLECFKSVKDNNDLYLSDLSSLQKTDTYTLFYSFLLNLGKTIGLSERAMSYEVVLSQMFGDNRTFWGMLIDVSNLCSQIRIGVDILKTFNKLELPKVIIYERSLTEYDIRCIREKVIETYKVLIKHVEHLSVDIPEVDLNSNNCLNEIGDFCNYLRNYLHLDSFFQELIYDGTLNIEFNPDFSSDVKNFYFNSLPFSDLTFCYLLGLAAKICTNKNVAYLESICDLNLMQWEEISEKFPKYLEINNIKLSFKNKVGRKLFSRLHYTIKLNFCSENMSDKRELNIIQDIPLLSKIGIPIKVFPNIISDNVRYNYSYIASFFGFSDISVMVLNSEDYADACKEIDKLYDIDDIVTSELGYKENVEFNIQPLIEVLELYINMDGRFSSILRTSMNKFLTSYNDWKEKGVDNK